MIKNLLDFLNKNYYYLATQIIKHIVYKDIFIKNKYSNVYYF